MARDPTPVEEREIAKIVVAHDHLPKFERYADNFGLVATRRRFILSRNWGRTEPCLNYL
jgi:hypothetical protein